MFLLLTLSTIIETELLELGHLECLNQISASRELEMY